MQNLEKIRLGISVVIPTHNRFEYIEPLLTSLSAAASNFPEGSEVILIDDSNLDVSSAIEDACKFHGARFFMGGASVREKRNLGIENAKYSIVLFVDSDCIVTPDLFLEHAKTYKELNVEEKNVAGVVGVTNFVGPDSFMWQVIKRTQYLNAFNFAERMEFVPWATCSNTSYRLDILNELGGFETKFPFRLGGDDSDLGIRLNKAGYRIKSNPKAQVNHTRATWTNFISIWKRAFRWGRMDVHLYYRRHKDHIIFGFPKFSNVFLCLLLISLLNFIVTFNPIQLFFPFVWVAIFLLTMAIQTTITKKEKWYFIIHELLADILRLAFEFGTVVEGMRFGEWSVLFKAVQRTQIQTSIKQQFLIQPWAMWVGILIIVLIQGLLLR
jgi:glycosyltransferase involved in cell wall biosynthesis